MARKHWVFLAALCVAGCSNDRLMQADGLPSAVQSLDFGEIPVGTLSTRELAITDEGRAPVEINAMALVSGAKTFAALPPSKVVRGAQKLPIALTFHPESEGEFSDELVLQTSSAETPELHVRLHGRAGPAAVRFEPAALDWGGVERGDSRELTVTVINPTDLPLALSSTAPGEFALSAQTVAPNSTTPVHITFHAGALGPRRVRLSASPCAGCTEARLKGKAIALASALAMEPNPLTWDGVPVHHSQDGSAMLRNLSWRPVNVQTLTVDGADFAVMDGPTGKTLAPGDALPVRIRFSPQHLGPSDHNLNVSYRSFAQREATGRLVGLGGGPQIAVTPLMLHFGDLPAGGKQRLDVYVQNAGNAKPLVVTGTVNGDGAFSTSLAQAASILPGDSVAVHVDFAPITPGSFSATLHLHSNDPATPEVVVQLDGSAHRAGPCQFALTPASLDFGNVPPGGGAVLGFRFEDTGREECAVKDIQLDPASDPAFFMPGGALVGGDLFPTDAFSAQVAFKSPGPGTFQGALVLTVNDPSNPHPRIPLVAHSESSCLVAAPPFIDFGAVRFDCSAHQGTTVVTNACDAPVTVSGVDLGQGTLPEFSLVAAPTTPLVMQPGDTFAITAQYARSQLGQQYAPLYVHAVGEPDPLLVPLLAEALHPGEQFDRFVQGSGSEADVLFVVSNTNTMGEYQQRLAGAVGQLLDTASAQGVSLHVGVTGTGLSAVSAGGNACYGGANGGEAGRLIPADGTAPRIVDLTQPNALQVLQQSVQAGTCQTLEQGLEAMRLALSPPLSDHADDPRTSLRNDGNAGFLRDEARLSVVVLADEDDHSGYDPATYVQFLKSLKGLDGARRAALYAIVPKDGLCATAGPPGDRFAEVAQQTGGAVYEICEGDYGPFLAQLAQRGLGAQSIFALSAVPDGGTMTVLLNGQVAGGSNWYYDVGLNAVVFNPGFIPPAGTQIEVDYTSACP